MKIKFNTTSRGFSYGEFTEANGNKCSLQISSACEDEALMWLGFDKIGLKTFTPYTGGWKDILEDEIKQKFNCQDILSNTRMHLTQSQVQALLPYLTKFAKTGEFV